MGTGILYAVIVVAWAAYLVPLIRSHRRESAPARSVDAFATSMRVLGKRTSARPGASGRVTGPAPRTAAARARAEEAQTMAAQSARGAFEQARLGRRRAARRRRTTLLVLLAATVTMAVLAYVGLVPWWSVAVPGGLAAVFLGASALAVRRMRPLRAPRTAQRIRPVAHRVAAPARRVEARPGSAADAAERSALADAAAWVADSQLGAWEPHPVALPQYVTAAPAVPRAVRSIDLGEQSVFSAGRLPETDLLRREPDTVEELARSAVDAAAGEGGDDSKLAAGA